MRYDTRFQNQQLPRCRHLAKGQNALNYSSHRPQKACTNPSFRCFFPYLVHISGAEFRSQDSCIRHRYQSNTVMYQPNTVPYQAKPCVYQPNITLTWMFFLSLK